MKKKLMTVLALVLVIAMSVAGTYAYLTSQTSVTNTFTVGKVAITMDEAKVDVDGNPVSGAARVIENTYKLIPGHKYTKDPTVHVDADSEDSYLFVKVENGIKNIEAAGDTTIAAQLAKNGWTALSGVENVYYYKDVVTGGANCTVFNEFTIAGDATTSNYSAANITINAYAVQADGFETAAKAWTASGFGA